MRTMKDSGVAWIGEIPEGWEVCKTKQIFSVYNGSTPKSDNAEYWDGSIVWITPAEMGENIDFITDSKRKITNIGLSSCGTILVPINSIVLSSRAPIGQVAIAGAELCTNQGCKSLVKKSDINEKYFFYFFKIQSEPLNILGKGTTFLELSSFELENFFIPNPPLPEQRRIAAYLDAKCAEIDRSMELVRQGMDKLREYKKSVITEAVTKGLDPDVPMKVSGVKWIGEIPEGWEKIRLRFLCDISTGDKDTVNQNIDGRYPFFVRSPKIEKIDTYSFDGEAILMAGDGVGAGKVFHYFIGKFDYHQRVYNLHNFASYISGKYLFYYLKVNFLRKIEEATAKSTVDSVRLPMLLDFPIVMGKITEQMSIVRYLDAKCAEIDALLAKKQALLDKLAEYKKSLIFECVTGKREVAA